MAGATSDEYERSYVRLSDHVIVRAWQWNGTRQMHLTGGLDGASFIYAAPGDWVVSEPDERGVFNRYRESDQDFRTGYREIGP